jgi:predicted dehydrogenase
MKKEAADANVSICMGYNKNVCKYVRNAREFAAGVEGSHVTFVSNNTYENNAESLGECFERNAEGMLKNMAIHELALLASFYDVTVDNIDSVEVDKDFSSCQTLKGPSGKEFTDFDKVSMHKVYLVVIIAPLFQPIAPLHLSVNVGEVHYQDQNWQRSVCPSQSLWRRHILCHGQ